MFWSETLWLFFNFCCKVLRFISGTVCHRKNLNVATGCCENGTKPVCNEPEGSECTSLYSCCTVFETCVSCCLTMNWDLSPARQIEELQHVSGPAFRYSKPTSLFDFCLIRCRTSSSSVVHQNTFRSKWKYCYGSKESPLILEDETLYTEIHEHKDPWTSLLCRFYPIAKYPIFSASVAVSPFDALPPYK